MSDLQIRRVLQAEFFEHLRDASGASPNNPSIGILAKIVPAAIMGEMFQLLGK